MVAPPLYDAPEDYDSGSTGTPQGRTVGLDVVPEDNCLTIDHC